LLNGIYWLRTKATQIFLPWHRGHHLRYHYGSKKEYAGEVKEFQYVTIYLKGKPLSKDECCDLCGELFPDA